MPVLDTNFLIALQDQDRAALTLLDEVHTERLLVPSIVAVEFLTGYTRGRREAHEALDAAFDVVHTDAAWIHTASQLRDRLRSKRRSIRAADFWIASWAVLHDTPVISRNVKDFEAMGVECRSW